MFRASRIYLLTTAAIVTAASANLAFAADSNSTPGAVNTNVNIVDQRGVGVADRARPGYDALGIHAGAFTILPAVNVSEVYDDNIYATDSDTKSDFITQISPVINVRSNWSRNALNLTAGLDRYSYADHSSEDRTDYNVGIDGRLDILRDTNFIGGVSYAQKHEERGSATAPTAAVEPVEYHQTNANLDFNQRFNRITATVGGTYTKLDYSNVAATGGGVLFEDLRNRSVYGEAVRLGYDVSPDTNVYVQGTLNQRRYETGLPVQNPDSKGYETDIGARFRLSNLASGEIFVGYLRQNYDAPGASDVSGLAYGANVNWFVTPLTTVRFKAASTVEESGDLSNSGYLRQAVDLGLDHELLRNVILTGDLTYENDDFKGITRTDNYYGAGIGANYLLNRYLGLAANYNFMKRSSDMTGIDYNDNRFMITLRGQL